MTYDLGKVVKWAIPLVWAALIFEALNLYHTWLYIDLLDRVQTSANYTMSEVDFVDTVGPLVAFPFIGILISAYVASGMWIYRAAHNANQISPSETRITPGWSVGWFFIPVASLWKPYQAMRHTWNTAMDAASDIDAETPGWFKLWWALWLIVNWGANISFRIWANGDGIESEIISFRLDVAGFVLTIILTFLFARLIRQVTDGLNRQGGPIHEE